MMTLAEARSLQVDMPKRPVAMPREWTDSELKVVAAPHYGRQGIIPAGRHQPIAPMSLRSFDWRKISPWAVLGLMVALATAWGAWGQR